MVVTSGLAPTILGAVTHLLVKVRRPGAGVINTGPSDLKAGVTEPMMTLICRPGPAADGWPVSCISVGMRRI